MEKSLTKDSEYFPIMVIRDREKLHLINNTFNYQILNNLINFNLGMERDIKASCLVQRIDTPN
jgi:hypothetical protein